MNRGGLRAPILDVRGVVTVIIIAHCAIMNAEIGHPDSTALNRADEMIVEVLHAVTEEGTDPGMTDPRPERTTGVGAPDTIMVGARGVRAL
jgi:hypothetical protein